MTPHVTWEMLNDAADGRLTPAEQAMLSEHVAECASCAAQRSNLGAVLAAAHAAPRHVDPPSAAWEEIRRAIDAKKSVPFPAASRREFGVRLSRRSLAAAALVLVAGSSAITALVVSRRPSTRVGADGASALLTAAVLSSDLVVLEREYLSSASALRATLEKERATLSPSTIATVERSLTVIDDAIAEAREALVQDPSNGVLRDLLRKSHQQKIEFLRRATALLGKA